MGCRPTASPAGRFSTTLGTSGYAERVYVPAFGSEVGTNGS
jgi:hypothetical protein